MLQCGQVASQSIYKGRRRLQNNKLGKSNK